MTKTMKKEAGETDVSMVNEKKSILRKGTVKLPPEEIKEVKDEAKQEQLDAQAKPKATEEEVNNVVFKLKTK